MLRVVLRYFSSVRSTVGLDSEAVYVDEGTTVSDLLARTIVRFPQLVPLEPSLLVARNAQYAAPRDSLCEGDVVDIMPPVCPA